MEVAQGTSQQGRRGAADDVSCDCPKAYRGPEAEEGAKEEGSESRHVLDRQVREIAAFGVVEDP
jgi:hypothetical protein